MALSASLMSLSACGVYGDHAMPTGYTYHHEEYKSPASVVSEKVTIEQKQYMDATQAGQFRNAVYDLLERLTMRAGMPPKPVYISAPTPMTTFYANLDNDLRESMRHIGYALSDSPQGAYVFTYEAVPLVDAGNNNVQIALRVFDSYSAGARQLTEETGQYFIQGADLLTMGSANQDFLKSSMRDSFKKAVQQPVQAVRREVVAPVPAPVVKTPVVRVPMVQAPVVPTSVPSSSKVVVAPVSMDSGSAPRATSRSVNAGKVSMPSLTSYADQREPSRSAIKVINHGDKFSASVPKVEMQKTMTDKLPSLEEIEAQIRQLDAEISKTNKAEELIRSRVSR